MPTLRAPRRPAPSAPARLRGAPRNTATPARPPQSGHRAVLELQGAAGNRAVARLAAGSHLGPFIQRMASRDEAAAMLPLSAKPEIAQMRTSIINMVGEYNDRIANYAAGFPKTPALVGAGGAQRYFDKTVAQLTSLIKSIEGVMKRYKRAEEARMRKVTFGKDKHQKRIDALLALIRKIDKGPPINDLSETHHRLYMQVMTQNPKLGFLGNQDIVGQTQSGAKSGGVHTLGKGQVKTSGGVKTGYFKSDKGESDDAGIGTDIEHTQAKQSMRSVATFEVNELLGLGIIPYTAMTKLKSVGPGGEETETTGQFMEEAKGYAGRGQVRGGEIDDSMYQHAQELIARIKDPKTTEKERKKLKNDLALGFGGGVVEIGGKKYRMTQAATDLDWLNPVLQKDLSTLQLFDIIVGHADRHAENYVVDYDQKKGTVGGVKGIDNDSTWGKHVDKKLLSNKGDFGYSRRIKTPGLPPVIDAEVALKVLRTDFNQIKAILQKYDMTNEEIAAAESRWSFVVDHVKNLVHAQQLAMMGGMDEGDQIFMYVDLYQAMGEDVPQDIFARRLKLWGKETESLQTDKNSYAGQQKAFLDDIKSKKEESFKPWEK